MSAAARALSYTQPAVSHHIARLRRKWARPSVVRHGRGGAAHRSGAGLAGRTREPAPARLDTAEEEVAAIAGTAGRPGQPRCLPYSHRRTGAQLGHPAGTRPRCRGHPGRSGSRIIDLLREGEVHVTLLLPDVRHTP